MNYRYQIIVLSLAFILLFLLCYGVWKIKSGNLTSEKASAGHWAWLHVRHAGGILIMLLIPALFLPDLARNWWAWPEKVSAMQVIVLITTAALLFTLSFREAKNNEINRASFVPVSFFQGLLYLLFRNGFLLVYEWFFRGILLFTCVQLFGTVPAIIINVALYALIHSFSGRKELIGSIPLGVVFCLLALWWQSPWPAMLLHLVLSVTYESLILKNYFSHPQKQIS
jgi:membrane protease YdiL (CAAX protease family)